MFDIVRRLSADATLRSAWRNAGLQGAELRQAQLQAPTLWAVGLLSYQSGATAAARMALLQAGRLDPSLLRNRQFSALFVRSLLGTQLVALLKRMQGSA